MTSTGLGTEVVALVNKLQVREAAIGEQFGVLIAVFCCVVGRMCLAQSVQVRLPSTFRKYVCSAVNQVEKVVYSRFDLSCLVIP